MKRAFQILQINVVIIAFWLMVASPGSAATATITVNNSPVGFVPATTNINVGDQVTWVWPNGSVFHNTVSSSGVWSSPVNNGPATYSFTFTSPGSFPYTCTIHGFGGTINVAAVAAPPVIFITNPTNNTTFAAPANVTIQATATNSDNTVTNVQFLVGTTILANDSSDPFSATATNVATGGYTLSAIASDSLGMKATNTVTINVVAPVVLTISEAHWLTPASFQFSYAANAGLNYVIQSSTNLALNNWTALITNTADGNPATFRDLSATNGPRFYRVGRLPNP